jgi:hypothetical protein
VKFQGNWGVVCLDLLEFEFLAVVLAFVALLNIVFSAVVATIAEKRNQSWGIYFVVGIIFGFSVLLLFVLLHDAINRHWRAEDRTAILVDSEESSQSTTF